MAGPVVVERGDRSRPLLVLVHGLGLGPEMWNYQLRILADRYHLIAPDLPGFGGPSGTTPFKLDLAVGYVVDLIASRSPTGMAHVCGFSMGSMIATCLAASHPHRVDRLVLTSNHVRLSSVLAARQAAAMRLMPSYRLVRPGYSKKLLLLAWNELTRADLRPLLPTIVAPTLVVLDRSDGVNRADSRLVERRVPNATRRVMWNAYRTDNGGHSGRFTKVMADFLAGSPG